MEQPPWHTQPSSVNQASTPIIPNEVNFTDNDKNSESSFPIGWIVLGIIAVLGVCLLGFGIFFFLQNNKVSSHEISLDEKSDYQLSPIFVSASTMGWKMQDFEQVEFKYPPEWEKGTPRAPLQGADQTLIVFNKTGVIMISKASNEMNSCSQFADDVYKNAKIYKNFSPSSQANYIYERGYSNINGINFYLFYQTKSLQGLGNKSISACFEKDGKTYIGSLTENGTNKKFENLKEYILFLNSLEIN